MKTIHHKHELFVSLADMIRELRARSENTAATDPALAHGYARVADALEEFLQRAGKSFKA